MAIKKQSSSDLPAVAGQSGKYLTNNGSVTSWGTVSSGFTARASQIMLPGPSGGYTGGFTAVPFTVADTVAGFSTALIGTNQFVATNTGLHFVTGSALCADDTLGFITMEYKINGATGIVWGSQATTAAGSYPISVGAVPIMLTAADTVSFILYASNDVYEIRLSLAQLC